MKIIGTDTFLPCWACLFIFSLITLSTRAQSLTLQECYALAEHESPLSGQVQLYDQLAMVKEEKLSAANRPQVDVNGQWTYQSAVFGLPVKLPNAEIPTIPNAQYQAYVNVEQTLFDGGVHKRSKELVHRELKTNQQKVVTDLYKVRETINALYFGVLRSQENEKSLHEVLHTLRERKKVIDARYANGLLLLSDKATFEKELLSIEQQLVAIETEKVTMIGMLADKLGQPLGLGVTLTVPENIMAGDLEINRPELEYFDDQKNLLDQSAQLLRSRNTPKLSAFARDGFGSPNPFRFFETSLSNFYIAGVRLHWKLFDWGMNKKDRQQLVIQQEILESSRKDLARQFENGSLQWKQKLAVIDEVMNRDAEIIRLQESIVKAYESRLENGSITSTDYIAALDQLTRAKITARMHEIDKSYYQVQYLTITGNL